MNLWAAVKCRGIGVENLVARLCFEYLKTSCNAAFSSLKRMTTMGENTKNKGGRPTLPDYQKKTCSVKVMFSPVDMIYLNSCASECGLSRAEYVYRAAMNQETTTLLTPEERTAVNELRNIGNNLNQITKAMHLGGQVEQDIRDIISFITGILRKVR